MNVRPVVLYDGGCRPCRGFARLLVRMDRHGAVALLPFDDPRCAPLVPMLTSDELRRSMHLVAIDGSVRSAGAAVAGVLVVLGGPWAVLGRRLTSGRTAAVLDRAYRAVADNRHRYGRFVPDRPAITRFP